MASVMMIGGTISAVAPSPLRAPIAAASASVAAMPTRPLGSHAGDISGRTMAATVITAPTDRSMPPLSTTSVCPAAAMPITAASSSR